MHREATPSYERRYLYEGMQVIGELDSGGNVLKTFYWGHDISDSPGGAGGIGGLLMVVDDPMGTAAGTKAWFVGYDGRGNVSLMLDSADGSLDAAFEYSPYGRTHRASGPAVAAMPFRYQTKWLLDNSPSTTDYWPTDLYDYGLRMYDAQMGRFISRDPIGENGGMNLYAAFGNDPVNRWDLLGLDDDDVHYLNPLQINTDRGDPCDYDGDDSVDYFEFMQCGGLGQIELPSGNSFLPPREEEARNLANHLDYSVTKAAHELRLMRIQDLINNAKKRKKAPLDWLKALCSSPAGRALVEALARGEFAVFESRDSFKSLGLDPEGNKIALNNSALGVTLIDPRWALMEMKTSYSGTSGEYMSLVLYEETSESANLWDADLAAATFSRSDLTKREKAQIISTFNVDRFSVAAGIPSRTPGIAGQPLSAFESGYVKNSAIITRKAKAAASGTSSGGATSSTGSGGALTPQALGYGVNVASGELYNAIEKGTLYTEWDCSRVD